MITFNTKEELGTYLLQEGVDTSTWEEEQWEGFCFEEEPTEPNLNFPAEVHIQELAILMKQAMDNSTPNVLKAGELHLPFITEEDRIGEIPYNEEEGIEQFDRSSDELIKISAARCAFTSYDKNTGKSIEQELATANSLIKDHHWSPFEHQAQAITDNEELLNVGFSIEANADSFGPNGIPKPFTSIPDGLEMRVQKDGSKSFWSRNFKNWIQSRALLDT